MGEIKSDLLPELGIIRKNLEVGNTLMRARTGREQSLKEVLSREIENRPTSIARSDFLVTPEEIILLEKQVNTVRNGVIQSGDYIEEEVTSAWVVEAGDYSVAADDQEHHTAEHTPSKLRLLMEDDQYSIAIDFRDENYRLEIGFSNEEGNIQWLNRYDSSWLPLESMTKEEGVIINHYLDQFCDLAHIQLNQD